MIRMLVFYCCLAAFFTNEVLGCSGSVDRNSPALRSLKNFLGIDFVDKMLVGGNTSYSETETITRPSDLNCDFEEPGLCRWTNYQSRGTDERDNVDFFLFRKVNSKRWPITPGKTPPEGTQFVLAGDQSPAPSGAIWLSSPIACQDGGILSFSYHIHNAAKIEVLLLRPGTDPIEDAILLNVDCPRFATREQRLRKNGNKCVVEIPSFDEPTQLGIRGHNLKNNFVVLDDITYTADLCSQEPTDPFDLGPSKRHVSGLTGSPIRNPSETECADFDGCRWGNADESGPNWAVQTTTPDAAQWRRLTGSNTRPRGSYLVLKSKPGGGGLDGSSGEGANFVTDPLPCQNGDGSFAFTYWVTEGSEIEFCAIDYESLEDIHCEIVGRAGAGRLRRIRIPGPIPKPFFLSLEGRVPESGGFVAVDDLAYDGDIGRCERFQTPLTTLAPKGAKDILRGLTTSPLTGGLTGESVEFPEDLSCDWGETPTGSGDSDFLCQWGNANSGSDGRRTDTNWKLVQGEVDPELLERTTGTTGAAGGPDLEFTAAEFGQRGGMAALHTDPVECQDGPGQLITSYWLSQGVELRLCPVILRTNRPAGGTRCTVVATGPASAKRRPLRVPADGADINEPFKLVLEASSRGEGFALVDDVEYSGALCEVTSAPTTPDPSTVTLVQSCRRLSCSVDNERSGLCNFRSLPRWLGDPRFRVHDGPIGGSTSNIQVGRDYPDRYYIGTVIKERVAVAGQSAAAGDVAVLRSSPFQIPRGTTASLSFKHQRSTVGTSLWLCRNEFARALDSFPLNRQKACSLISGGPRENPREILQVNTATVTLRPEDYRVIIVAYHPSIESRGAGGFLIDDIELTYPNGDNLC